MSPSEQLALDAIADRLGALYQRVGRLTPSEDDATSWQACLDEIVQLTEDIETVSGRVARQ